MEQWFSSDHHFHHANIIEYAKRPFKDVWEMNEFMVQEHNKVVKTSDHWTTLGDITMFRGSKPLGLEIIKRLNGHKRAILGNHDHYDMKHYVAFFEKVYAMHLIDRMRFTHIPIHPSSMFNQAANIHGHIHIMPAPDPVLQVIDGRVVVKPYINICVEQTEYRPITLGEIKERVAKCKDQWEGVKV